MTELNLKIKNITDEQEQEILDYLDDKKFEYKSYLSGLGMFCDEEAAYRLNEYEREHHLPTGTFSNQENIDELSGRLYDDDYVVDSEAINDIVDDFIDDSHKYTTDFLEHSSKKKETADSMFKNFGDFSLLNNSAINDLSEIMKENKSPEEIVEHIKGIKEKYNILGKSHVTIDGVDMGLV